METLAQTVFGAIVGYSLSRFQQRMKPSWSIIEPVKDAAYYAVKNNDLNALKRINTNSVNEDAFRLAVENENLEMVKYFVEVCKYEDTSTGVNISSAAHTLHLDLVKYLVESGFYVKGLGTVVFRYDRNDTEFPVIEYLLSVGAQTDLTSAVRTGNIHLVKLMLKYGANVHEMHDAPLKYACVFGEINIVKLLVESGANVNAIDFWDSKGITPLVIASEYGHIEIMEYLLSKGAQVNHPSEFAKIAIEETITTYGELKKAQSRRFKPLSLERLTSVVKLLLSHGAKVPRDLIQKANELEVETEILQLLQS